MFRIFDLNYFHSNLEKFYNKSDIVTIEKKIIYREIYIFCRKVDDYVTIVKKKRLEIICLHAFKKTHCISN